MSAFRFKGEIQELNEYTRAAAPGDFVKLPTGYSHYELGGPKDGSPVVLIHGFSIPYYIWDPTFEALADGGFLVLRYDLVGRGFSDRPDVTYDLNLFVNQLRSIIEQLELKTPVDLVGLSMGGPISVSFCDRYPDLARKLCLIDPGGVTKTSTVLSRLLLRSKIGEWIFSLFGNRILLSQLAKDLAEPDNYPAYVEMAKTQLKFQGYKRALLSTLRNNALSDLSALYRTVGRQKLESLLIWGSEDRLIPIKHSRVILETFPGIVFHQIDGAGHIPHYEKPDDFNPILVGFLSA